MKLDVSSLGNAIVDVQFSIEEDFVSTLEKMSIQKGSMTLIEAEEQSNLIDLLNKEYGNSKLSCGGAATNSMVCLLYTSPSPRDVEESRMPSSA